MLEVRFGNVFPVARDANALLKKRCKVLFRVALVLLLVLLNEAL